MNKKHFIFLWLGCVVGVLSVIPYTLSFYNLSGEHTLGKLILLSLAQGIVFYGILLGLAYLILPKIDLKPFLTTNGVKRIFIPGIISGVMLGVILVILNKWVFAHSTLSGMHPPRWMGALASLYGGINEEVLMRLFLFSLLYFFLAKILKPKPQRHLYLLWSVNILVALAFGVGHLPMAFKIAPPSCMEISRILLLNGIPGIVFGWLYWSRGIYAAALSHFVTDLVFHVAIPSKWFTV